MVVATALRQLAPDGVPLCSVLPTDEGGGEDLGGDGVLVGIAGCVAFTSEFEVGEACATEHTKVG